MVAKTATTMAAMLGLELFMVSQVCENFHSRCKWTMGSVFLISFIISSRGLLNLLILLWNQDTLNGFP